MLRRRVSCTVVAQRAARGQIVPHAVALDVGLAVNVEAQRVAQLVEAALLRIVAGADRVDVVRLHQPHVPEQQLLVDVVPRAGVVFVEVDSLEFHGLSVDEQHAVGASLGVALGGVGELEAAESHREGDVDRPFGCPHVHHEPVAVGRFGRPMRCVGYLGTEQGFARCLLPSRGDGAALGIEQFVARLDLPIACEEHFQREKPRAVAVVERRYDLEIAQRVGRFGREVDRALDAADAPEVLRFEVGTGAPPRHFERQRILARTQEGVDAVLRRILRIFVVTRFAAVDIDVDARFGAADRQVDPASRPRFGDGEGAAVDACRNRLGQVRRRGIDRGVFVARVDVDRRAVSLQLPVARNADVVPRRSVGVGGRRVGGQGADVVRIAEFPYAVERAVGVAPLEGAHERLVARGELHEFGAGRFAVDFQHGEVAVVGFLGCGRRREGGRQQGEGSFHEEKFWVGSMVSRKYCRKSSRVPAVSGGTARDRGIKNRSRPTCG